MKRRTMIACGIIALLFVLLIGRLIYFSIFKNGIYKRQVLSQQNYSSETLPYKRGDILDRDGNTLATSQKMYTLVLEPKNILRSEEVQKATIDALHKYMKLDEDKLLKFIKRHKDSYYSVYREELSYSQIADLKDFIASDKAENVSGIVFNEKYKRRYPNQSLASQVIGFISDGTIGTGGIEQYYNSTLSGVDGRKYKYLNEELEQDSSIVEPENGKTVVTTIDSNIQKLAEDQLSKFEKKYGSKGSSILVMNPNNGEIYAMVNVPEYDLNDPFSLSAKKRKANSKKQQEYLNKKWRNSCLNDTYEPGSVFKIVTATAGLESSKVSVNDHFNCPGFRIVEDRKIRCHKVGGHGSETFKEGVMNSCNPVFMDVGARVGVDGMYQTFRQLGLFEKTGIDLPGEASSIMHQKKNVGAVELATMSFGQSIQITPLQLLRAVSAVINGGKLITPHFGRYVQKQDGTRLKAFFYSVKEGVIKKQTSETMKELLEAVVSDGSGRNCRMDGFSIGGKTATSEKLPRGNGKYISSFLGFAKADNPAIIGIVLIDEPHGTYYGGTIAAPVMRSVFQTALPYMGIYKEYTPDKKEP